MKCIFLDAWFEKLNCPNIIIDNSCTFFLFFCSFFLLVWQQNSNKSVVMISIFLLLGSEDLENVEIQSIRGNRLNFIVWTWQREMKMWISRVFIYEIKTNFCKVFLMRLIDDMMLERGIWRMVERLQHPPPHVCIFLQLRN